MTTFADKLLTAAEDVDHLPPSDLQLLLRRAAFRIQKVTDNRGTIDLDDDIREIIDGLAASAGFDRNATANAFLRDWLQSHGHLDSATGQ